MKITFNGKKTREWKEEEEEPEYNPLQPISIFNHPPFLQMSIREIRELEDSWP